MIIQALYNTKNPKSLPVNHPGRQLNSVWSQLSVDESFGLFILNANRIFVPKTERKGLFNNIHAATGKTTDINLLVHECDIC